MKQQNDLPPLPEEAKIEKEDTGHAKKWQQQDAVCQIIIEESGLD